MYKYVAFIWNTRDVQSQREALRLINAFHESTSEWRYLINYDGLAVFDLNPPGSAFDAQVLPDKRGVLLGRVFPVDAAGSSDVTINTSTARRFTETRGTALTADYWGAYVAILNDWTTGACHLIRDCSGQIPCFWTVTNKVNIAFADIDDIRSLPRLSLSIDWSYLAAFLFYEQLQIRRSALLGVNEVLAGDAVEFNDIGFEQRIHWDPSRVARDPVFDDPLQASNQLRDTTLRCIADWASIYDRIILNLSGGLDSSIILGCLAKAARRPDVTCVNCYTEDPAGDERIFARLAASSAEVPLIERHWQSGAGALDKAVLHMKTGAKPSIPVLAAKLYLESRNELVRQLGATATWTGEGGDHLFFADAESVGAADYLRTRGLRPGIFRAIAESSRVTGESYWSVTRGAISGWHTKSPWQPSHIISRESFFLNPEAIPPDIFKHIGHPCTQDIASLPIGKQFQIFFLAEVTNRHRTAAIGEEAADHHPLLSQPLMELCLKLPTYTLHTGGRSRGLARDAFAGYVPQAILAREQKGSTTSFWIHVLHQSNDFFRELLFDGILRREHLLNVTALERYLDPSRPVALDGLSRLFAALAAEIWARSWTVDRSRIAA